MARQGDLTAWATSCHAAQLTGIASAGTYRLEDSGYTRRKQRRQRLVASSPEPLFPGPKFEAVLSLDVFISKGASTWRVLFKSTFSYPLGILV